MTELRLKEKFQTQNNVRTRNKATQSIFHFINYLYFNNYTQKKTARDY